MPPALDVLWALLLIGVALFVGAILLRRVPTPWLAFAAVLVVFGFGIPALVIDDHKSKTSGGGGSTATAAPSSGGSTTTTTTPAAGSGTTSGGGKKKTGGGAQAGGASAAELAKGKQIFQQNCGTCHTLADAGTNGKVGPVLDQVKPSMELVLSAVQKGGLGSGTMPANIVTGADAKAVATYVSTVAGK
jgi:mono/diheme cytochrome c family protein